MTQLNAAYVRNLTSEELCRVFANYDGGLDKESNALIVAELIRRLEDLLYVRS